jgi:hypothetical protein
MVAKASRLLDIHESLSLLQAYLLENFANVKEPLSNCYLRQRCSYKYFSQGILKGEVSLYG